MVLPSSILLRPTVPLNQRFSPVQKTRQRLPLAGPMFIECGCLSTHTFCPDARSVCLWGTRQSGLVLFRTGEGETTALSLGAPPPLPPPRLGVGAPSKPTSPRELLLTHTSAQQPWCAPSPSRSRRRRAFGFILRRSGPLASPLVGCTSIFSPFLAVATSDDQMHFARSLCPRATALPSSRTSSRRA